MRKLTAPELALLQRLTRAAGLSFDLDSLEVEELNDGGMGSLRLGAKHAQRRTGAKAAELSFADSDGVQVSAALYLDKHGAPYELDVFKIDFTPTQILKSQLG